MTDRADLVPPDKEPPSGAVRILVAMILGVLGLVTGYIAVSVFSDLPGVPIPDGASLAVGIALGGGAATCRFCRQRSRLSGTAVNVQFGILVAAFASVPWLPEGDTRVAAGYLAAAVILAVGLFAPMRRDLTS